MIQGLYLLDERAYHLIYGPEVHQQIEALVNIYAPPQTAEMIAQHPALLAEAQVIFSGWGCPMMSEELLFHALELKVIFYGAGSIRYLVTPEFWEQGIQITSAYRANGIPVSEFALAQITLSLKRYWQHTQQVKAGGGWWNHLPVAGAYGSTVGLVSLGMIGRMMVERLKSLEVHVIAYDPFATPEEAERLGIELCSLEEVFCRADVVSLHTPWLPETVGLVRGAHLASMKEGATLINTSRGAIVREDEMVEVLQRRPDLYALLDVTYPEPPEPSSPLRRLPNVIISPHIAGSLDRECLRNGQYMVDELKRYLSGQPLQYAITRERAAIMA